MYLTQDQSEASELVNGQSVSLLHKAKSISTDHMVVPQKHPPQFCKSQIHLGVKKQGLLDYRVQVVEHCNVSVADSCCGTSQQTKHLVTDEALSRIVMLRKTPKNQASNGTRIACKLDVQSGDTINSGQS